MATKTYQRTAPRRIINALSRVVVRLGMSSRTSVFTTGRTSGETRSTPVDLTRVDGQVYVVGIYGPDEAMEAAAADRPVFRLDAAA